MRTKGLLGLLRLLGLVGSLGLMGLKRDSQFIGVIRLEKYCGY